MILGGAGYCLATPCLAGTIYGDVHEDYDAYYGCLRIYRIYLAAWPESWLLQPYMRFFLRSSPSYALGVYLVFVTYAYKGKLTSKHESLLSICRPEFSSSVSHVIVYEDWLRIPISLQDPMLSGYLKEVDRDQFVQ